MQQLVIAACANVAQGFFDFVLHYLMHLCINEAAVELLLQVVNTVGRSAGIYENQG